MNTTQIFDQGTGKMNEDAVLVGTTRFGVFDGVSRTTGYTDEHGKTGGYLAAQIAKEVFLQSDLPLVQTALLANKTIATAMEAKGVDTSKKENCWGTTMAVIDIDLSQQSFKWAQVADSLIVAIYRDGTHMQLIQDDYEHDRGMMLLWKELADKHTPDIRLVLDREIRDLRQDVNRKFGVLNGEPGVSTFIRTGGGSLEHVSHLLLFTDGLIPPKEDPTTPDDFSVVVELYQKGGLQEVRDYIRKIEDTDPNCWKYPRYKKSDDIGAIAIDFLPVA